MFFSQSHAATLHSRARKNNVVLALLVLLSFLSSTVTAIALPLISFIAPFFLSFFLSFLLNSLLFLFFKKVVIPFAKIGFPIYLRIIRYLAVELLIKRFMLRILSLVFFTLIKCDFKEMASFLQRKLAIKASSIIGCVTLISLFFIGGHVSAFLIFSSYIYYYELYKPSHFTSFRISTAVLLFAMTLNPVLQSRILSFVFDTLSLGTRLGAGYTLGGIFFGTIVALWSSFIFSLNIALKITWLFIPETYIAQQLGMPDLTIDSILSLCITSIGYLFARIINEPTLLIKISLAIKGHYEARKNTAELIIQGIAQTKIVGNLYSIGSYIHIQFYSMYCIFRGLAESLEHDYEFRKNFCAAGVSIVEVFMTEGSAISEELPKPSAPPQDLMFRDIQRRREVGEYDVGGIKIKLRGDLGDDGFWARLASGSATRRRLGPRHSYTF